MAKHNKKAKAKAKAIVKQWIETDVLRIDQYMSKRHGREVPVVIAGTIITREEAGL